MNDYLIAPLILVMVVLFMVNILVLDAKFDKVHEKFYKAEIQDIEFKYKLESIDRELQRLRDDVRRK